MEGDGEEGGGGGGPSPKAEEDKESTQKRRRKRTMTVVLRKSSSSSWLGEESSKQVNGGCPSPCWSHSSPAVVTKEEEMEGSHPRCPKRGGKGQQQERRE